MKKKENPPTPRSRKQLVVIIDDDPVIGKLAQASVERFGGQAIPIKSYEDFWMEYAMLFLDPEVDLQEVKFVIDGDIGDRKHGPDSFSATITRFLIDEGHGSRIYRHSDRQLLDALAGEPALLCCGQIVKGSPDLLKFCNNGFRLAA